MSASYFDNSYLSVNARDTAKKAKVSASRASTTLSFLNIFTKIIQLLKNVIPASRSTFYTNIQLCSDVKFEINTQKLLVQGYYIIALQVSLNIEFLQEINKYTLKFVSQHPNVGISCSARRRFYRCFRTIENFDRI